MWAQACLAYSVQAQLHGNATMLIRQFQDMTAKDSPVRLHLIPQSALHCSVVTLIAPDSKIVSKAAAWRRIREAIEDDLIAIIRGRQSIPTHFDAIRVTRHAVVALVHEQPPIFAELRTRFARLLDRLNLPSRTYSQTHVTLARFAQDGRVDPALFGLSHILPVTFTGLKLVREVRYPSLELEDVSSSVPGRRTPA
jgi:hypothetical protein